MFRMKTVIKCIIFLVVLVTFVQTQNYCNPALCPRGTHTACGNTGQFSQQCPSDARAVTLGPRMRNLLLQMHNVRRNRIAGGNLPGYSSARRMPVVRWDNELARLALMNSKRCVMQHDTCRNTPNFQRSGQNIAIASSTGNAQTLLRRHLIQGVQFWFREYQDADMSVINSFRTLSKPIGHFTLMVNDRVTRIGCGTVRYTRNGRRTLLTNCNYASTNIYQRTVYVAGQTASGCTTGTHGTYPNLCSSRENVNPNVV